MSATHTDNRITSYLAGKGAFARLTGQINKEEEKATLVKGYQDLHSIYSEEGQTLQTIADAAGVSQSKVERDVRAALIISTMPKVDPVTAVKAANVANATQIKKATKDPKKAGKALGELVKADNAKKRAARPSAAPKAAPKQAPKTSVTVTWANMDAVVASLGIDPKDIPLMQAAIKGIESKITQARSNTAGKKVAAQTKAA